MSAGRAKKVRSSLTTAAEIKLHPETPWLRSGLACLQPLLPNPLPHLSMKFKRLYVNLYSTSYSLWIDYLTVLSVSAMDKKELQAINPPVPPVE